MSKLTTNPRQIAKSREDLEDTKTLAKRGASVDPLEMNNGTGAILVVDFGGHQVLLSVAHGCGFTPGWNQTAGVNTSVKEKK